MSGFVDNYVENINTEIEEFEMDLPAEPSETQSLPLEDEGFMAQIEQWLEDGGAFLASAAENVINVFDDALDSFAS